MRRRQAPWWHWALRAALVIVVYLPVLRADFVNWDDDLHVLDHPCVTDPDGLWRCWGEPWTSQRIPGPGHQQAAEKRGP